MRNSEIVIGSRGSDLALWQAYYIKDLLDKEGHSVRIQIIKTQGDIIQHLSFDKMEGKGFFTKELETALLDNIVDLAVHSFKDLETNQPEDLSIAAILNRANPADILLIRKGFSDSKERWTLKKNIKVGTSSARRKMQLTLHRPDLEIDDIRGNVPTRVQKLRDGNFDAIVLAKAGLDRLNLDVSDLDAYEFDPREFIPAPAQGALACQIRSTDTELGEILQALHNPKIANMVATERKVLNLFDGGCQLPLGAYCIETADGVELRAIMAPSYGEMPSTVFLQAKTTDGLAQKAAAKLKKNPRLSLFLSRDYLGDFFIALERKLKISIEKQSCISLQLKPNLALPEADWIFFLSPSGVELFSEKFDASPYKIGVIGSGTARAVKAQGWTVAFFPKSTDPKAGIDEFAEMLPTPAKVIMACSDKSLKRIHGIVS